MTTKKFRSKVMTPEQFNKIERLNFFDARRMKGPIYDVLITELLEAGCKLSARHFTCLVAKEEKLYEENFVHERVRDNRVLLMALFENAKMAETALSSEQCDGTSRCMKVLLQTLIMLQAYSTYYHWLVKSVYIIVANIAEKYGEPNPKCAELVSKIYYVFAEYHSSENDKNTESIDYYRKSLRLCRGQIWQTNDLAPSYELRFLQEVVSEHLSARLIKVAKSIELVNPEKGLELAHQAVITIAGVTSPNVNYLLCKALLVKTNLLLHQNRFKDAMGCVLLTEKKLRNGMFAKFISLICELYLYKGQCLQFKHNYARAMLKFKQSLLISRKYKLREFEAMALLSIGKVCLHLPDGQRKAHDALCLARDIFHEQKNLYHEKCSVYLLAQIQYQKHFKNFMHLMKGADMNFCDLYRLRKWKEQGIPYWTQGPSQAVYKLKSAISDMSDMLRQGLLNTDSETSSLAPTEALSKLISRLDATPYAASKECLLLEGEMYAED